MVEVTDRLDTLWALWETRREGLLRWNTLFVLPPWLQAWKDTLGSDDTLCVVVAHEAEGPSGVLPLVRRGSLGLFAGDPNVCDYFDAVAAPGREKTACRTFLQGLWQEGLEFLDLWPLRPQSTILTHLVPLCQEAGCAVDVSPTDVTVDMALPDSWEAYLSHLSGKQRHEVRRKMRRLEEAGSVSFSAVTEPEKTDEALERFFHLFQSNREDKARFLTETMKRYFRALCHGMSHHGLLRFCFLDLNGAPAAAALCFDDGETVYLYNNGYDAAYAHLSVGLVNKILTIKDAVERGRRRYEFLRGDETYKLRLGGQDVPLYRARITLEAGTTRRHPAWNGAS